ncbi:signal peptidase II [Humibacter albus]|uniref:signal peptidase II n=1 Tax=Humibacter albus TaxID=427754 RepID=UPI0003B400CB|nr:signal peptidase II [Humibacter albus]
MEAKPAGKVNVRAIILLAVVALVVLTLDQLAKWWVVNNLPFQVPKNIVGNLLIFEYDRNSGAAFSIGTGSTWIFSIIATAVLVFVIWYARRIRSVVWALVFGLVLGGLLGNLSDRLFRPPGFGTGEVVDFLRIPLLPAIFNLADSAIVCAMILFLILTVMGVGLDGKRPVPKASTAAADSGTSGKDASPSATEDGTTDASAAVVGEAGVRDDAAQKGIGSQPADSTDADDAGRHGGDAAEAGGRSDGADRAESRMPGIGVAPTPTTADGRG